MKKPILIIATIFLMTLGSFAQAQKIGTINTALVIDTLPAKDSALAQLAKIEQGYTNRLRYLDAEMQNQEKDYHAKVASKATPTQLELITKSFQRLQQDAKETEETAKAELQQEQARLYKPIVDAVKKATADVAKARGYSHIIDNSQGSVFWSANIADDLTGAVIAQMLKK
ncbi:MAG: OmpH family outer membrane protein [Flavobacteriaceae bacterium]|nr:OmpH family outer membrane protein [Flavobacteriaceae bacterium]